MRAVRVCEGTVGGVWMGCEYVKAGLYVCGELERAVGWYFVAMLT